MESLRSPLELMTLFFALSIGFYVFLFWRAQRAERRMERELQNLRPKRPSHPVATGRRLTSNRPLTEVTINRIFESDKDSDLFTSH